MCIAYESHIWNNVSIVLLCHVNKTHVNIIKYTYSSSNKNIYKLILLHTMVY